jgi:hypothetical protein
LGFYSSFSERKFVLSTDFIVSELTLLLISFVVGISSLG